MICWAAVRKDPPHPQGDPPIPNCYREQIGYGEVTPVQRQITLQRLLRNACFPKAKKQKNGTDSQKLHPKQNATDSRAVVSLVQEGALGY